MYNLIDIIISALETYAFVVFIDKYERKQVKSIKSILAIIFGTAVTHFSTVLLPPGSSLIISFICLFIVSYLLLTSNLKTILISYCTIMLLITVTDALGWILCNKVFGYNSVAQIRTHNLEFGLMLIGEILVLILFIINSKRLVIVINNYIGNKKFIIYVITIAELIIFGMLNEMGVSYNASVAFQIAFITLAVYMIFYFMNNFTTNDERDICLNQIQLLRRYIRNRQNDDSQILSVLYANLELGKMDEVKEQLGKLLKVRSENDWDSVMDGENSSYMIGFAKLYFNDTKIIIDERISLSAVQADKVDIIGIFKAVTNCVYEYDVDSLEIRTLDYYDQVLIAIEIKTKLKMASLELAEINERVNKINGTVEVKLKANIIKFKIWVSERNQQIDVSQPQGKVELN